MLEPLGISAEAEAMYAALAPLRSGAVEDIPELLSVAPESVDAPLHELRQLGLLSLSADSTWQSLPLLDVVNQLRAQRLSEIERASLAAEALESQLLAAGEDTEDGVKILVGRDAIVETHRELLDSAKREICAFDKGPYAQSRPDITADALADEPEWRALDRKIPLRCVYHPGFDSDRLTELALFAEKGEQSRTAPVPMKLILVDSQVALIPSMRSYNAGHELRASIVRHPLLVEALQWLFEAVWDASVPIMTAFSADNDPRRQMLISMLMTGSTDSAIATTLNINVRSVRRWISELMDELGVTTRLQLGAALVRTDVLRASAHDRANATSATVAEFGPRRVAETIRETG